MHHDTKVILSQTDYQKLFSLVNALPDATELLEDELNRASVVPAEDFPSDVVSMNSIVSFIDVETGTESAVTLVYPHESNIAEGKISILAPVGSALIGLKVGQVIRWPLPNGKERTLKVVSVLHQKE